MTVEKVWHDLWGGVKVSSNWEIARSRRNNFRVSLRKQVSGVELLDGEWGRKATLLNQTPNTDTQVLGDSPGVTISSVKRGTTQIAS